MAIRDLKEEMSRLPEQPGVYLYFNGNGETIYVGRARVLKDRVRSYLTAHGQSPKTDALLEEAEKLEIIVTEPHKTFRNPIDDFVVLCMNHGQGSMFAGNG